MLLRDKDKPMISKGLVGLSLLSCVVAGASMAGYDLYLASTQWLIIGILFAVWAVYLLLEAEFRA